ncbi:PQQ-like beta-propeller repeat protein [Kitasatospora sp. NBC_01560]|uniref:outer membrane protein assembly factor BamB family protein n=1 Tax=Kitasatospora sp. NBC_01560 TaxID=2975965 RepID=UPI00386959C8
MRPTASDRSGGREAEQPGGASWQWDGAADDAEQAPVDVVAGGSGEDGGPWLSRRRLLGGAGALVAGGALWAFARSGDGGAEPAPPRPRPTRLTGPDPVWTYRGPEAMTPERLSDRPARPVFLSRAGLQVLDPATGALQHTLGFAAPPADWPSDAELPDNRVVTGGDRVFTISNGHLDGRLLTDPAAGWSAPLPEELGATVTLIGCDGDVVLGRVRPRPFDSPDNLFAVRYPDRHLLWSGPAVDGERPLSPPTAAGGHLPLLGSAAGASRLTLLATATGERLWSVPAEPGTGWAVTDAEHVYAPAGAAGVRALRVSDGAAHWSVLPGRSEEWRCLPPVSDGTRVYLPRDDGLVTAHAAATGARLWAHRLPFRLDRRSRLLLAGPTLFVPGPAAAGVRALDAATGEERWTFRDSGPGVDVWSLSNDAARLYAGHDDVLHALPLP